MISRRLWSSLRGVIVLLFSHMCVIHCTTGGNIPEGRTDPGFTVTSQGTAYLFGGSKSGFPDNSLFSFDPLESTWQQLANTGVYTPDGRIFSTLWMAPNGRLYLYGGYNVYSDRKCHTRFRACRVAQTWCFWEDIRKLSRKAGEKCEHDVKGDVEDETKAERYMIERNTDIR